MPSKNTEARNQLKHIHTHTHIHTPNISYMNMIHMSKIFLKYIEQTLGENNFFTATEKMETCDCTSNIHIILSKLMNNPHIKSSKNTSKSH